MEKLLNKLGYFRVKNTDDLLNLYVSFSDSLEIDFDPVEEKKMFKQLKEVDGFMLWIESILAGDIKKHFGAQGDKQRDNIRGMMQRFIDFKRRLITVDKPVITKISGVRYGS